MSATQELIAAALTAADELHDLYMEGRSPATFTPSALREACARAMVQPDIAEVERLLAALMQAADSGAKGFGLSVIPLRQRMLHTQKARTALLDAVRAIAAERDQFRDAAKMVRRADGLPASPEKRHLRRLLAARVAMPGAYYDDGEAYGQEHGIAIDFMREPVADIDAKLRALNVARLEFAPQPVGDVPMPDAVAYRHSNTHDLHDTFEEVQLADAESEAEPLLLGSEVRTYGDAREAAGYAAGVAAGGKDAERYRWLRNSVAGWYVGPAYETHNDAICEGEYLDLSAGGVALDSAIDAALRGEVKP